MKYGEYDDLRLESLLLVIDIPLYFITIYYFIIHFILHILRFLLMISLEYKQDTNILPWLRFPNESDERSQLYSINKNILFICHFF